MLAFRNFFSTLVAITVFLCALGTTPIRAENLEVYLQHHVSPEDLAPGADAFGEPQDDMAVVPVLKQGEPIAWAFLTSDFVGTTGYSGEPIHIVAALDQDGVFTGLNLVDHSEPILINGIAPNRRRLMLQRYVGRDITLEGRPDLRTLGIDMISGATVTVMVVDDSIIRSSYRVASMLGLGGLEPPLDGAALRQIDPEQEAISDWASLSQNGSIGRLSLDLGQINDAFAKHHDERARRLQAGDRDDSFADLYMAVATVPTIGKTLLGEAEYERMLNWLDEDEQAILIMGRGSYSHRDPRVSQVGMYERIQLKQGSNYINLYMSDRRRIAKLETEDSPEFLRMDLYKIPTDRDFYAALPFEFKLNVERSVGSVKPAVLSYSMSHEIPGDYFLPAPPPEVIDYAAEEAAAKAALIERIWHDRTTDIIVLLAMLAVVTATFFFQFQATWNARRFYWFRMGFLTLTLVFIGWYANAQLSVVNLLALIGNLRSGFTWDTFLMDPLVFIQWFAIAAALLFWGRGAYCGWLCPFGALQELTNQIARFFKVPQITVPWALHERLWPIKYMIFLGLFGASLVSLTLAEQLAEVEPFKTAIILKFMREWPFVVFALSLLFAGLFIERFYCRYLCPLGGALAIPARLRMFDWIKRYRECGSPCQSCANTCPVQAIHPTGEVNPNECVNCLHCQVLYQNETKCPVVIRQLKRRASAGAAKVAPASKAIPQNHPNAKTTS